ncbi:Telomerase reverse transcriptase [Armadillidium vulgare]|nr:Telomerase reverse transcriptase [Armadillidium vulgare]
MKVGTCEVNVKKTIENIKRLVNTQLFQIGVRQRFLIVKGIAQGGSLSSDLCDLYYSAMCDKYLRNFTGNERIMMRSVDDFLYITPMKTQAEEFLRFMEQGIDEFNCHINPGKTMHNLDNECPFLKSRFSKLVSHPVITSIPALVANIWRTGLNIGARLPCLIKILLIPERNCNSKFLAKNVQGLGKIIWSKLKIRWKNEGYADILSRSLCITVFLMAVHLMLQKGIRQPPLKDLTKNIKKRFTNLLREIPDHERKFLPQLKLK